MISSVWVTLLPVSLDITPYRYIKPDFLRTGALESARRRGAKASAESLVSDRVTKALLMWERRLLVASERAL